MNLNLGCGYNKLAGFVNVDDDINCNPDVFINLERFSYPWHDNSIDEILLDNVLEHLGRDVEVYFKIWKELYRICKPGALITIKVPHPRHDNFRHDPTHCRIVTPEGLNLFSKKVNIKDVDGKSSKLALRLDIDFEIKRYEHLADPFYVDKFGLGSFERDSFLFNNVIYETVIELICIK